MVPTLTPRKTRGEKQRREDWTVRKGRGEDNSEKGGLGWEGTQGNERKQNGKGEGKREDSYKIK